MTITEKMQKETYGVQIMQGEHVISIFQEKNYELVIDSSCGIERAVDTISEYVANGATKL